MATTWPLASKSSKPGMHSAGSSSFTGFVLQRSSDLRGEFIVQPIDQITGMVSHVADVQSFAALVARIEHFFQIIRESTPPLRIAAAGNAPND